MNTDGYPKTLEEAYKLIYALEQAVKQRDEKIKVLEHMLIKKGPNA